MSSVNAGRVELDIVALAKDQVSATLREVNKSLAGTKAQMDSVKGATAGTDLSMKAIYGTQEKLSKALGLAGFAGALVGAVTGLAEFATALLSAGTAMEDLKDRAKEFGEGRDAMSRGLDLMREKLGIAKNKTDDLYNAAVVGASAARLEVDTLDRAYGEQQKRIADNLSSIQEAKRLAGDTAYAVALELTYRKDIDLAQREAVRLMNERKRVAGEIADFEKVNLEYLQKQNIEVLKLAAMGVLPGAGLFLGAGFGQVVKPGTPTPPRPPVGAGPRTDAAEYGRKLYESQRNALDVLDAMGLGDTDPGQAGSGKRRGGLGGGIGRQLGVLEENKAAVAALASEYDRLGASINGLAGPLGMLSGGLGEVTRALGTGLTEAAQFTSGDILGGIGSVLGGIIDLFGGTEKKTRDLVRQADLDRNKGAPSTVVINVAPGTDPQSVARELRRVDYSSRGTGARNSGV